MKKISCLFCGKTLTYMSVSSKGVQECPECGQIINFSVQDENTVLLKDFPPKSVNKNLELKREHILHDGLEMSV